MLRLDTARAEWRGHDVGLTRHEYDMVAMLATEPGRFVTYRAIYDALYYEGFLAGQGLPGVMVNVRSHIRRIRSKFLQIDPNFDGIINLSRVGYAWRQPLAS